MVRTTPDDDYDRKLLSDLETHGWHLVGIDDDPDGPAYVFSVGIFHTLGQPEMCIFGLNNTTTMAQIINGIGNLMRSGRNFDDWSQSDEVIDGYPCVFRHVDPSLYREYFGYALWFYESSNFPMLQCVWPDKEMRFPWESEYNAQMIQSQPVLDLSKSWPFLENKNLGILTTSRILLEGFPILLVTHDDNDDWQFLCGTTNDPDDGQFASLSEIVEHHPSVAALADLPVGWRAQRDAPDQPWRRSKSV